MKATKTVLVAATATKIATAGVNPNCLVQTALTDLFLGESAALTSDSATSFKYGSIATPVAIPLQGDLWAISATGGNVYVLQPE